MSKRNLRRYRRMPINEPVRFTVNAIDDYVGRVTEISPGDLVIRSNALLTAGDAVVASIHNLDVIEGRVARIFPSGFALSFRLASKRRRMLTDALMLRLNPEYALPYRDQRQSPRHIEADRRMACRLPDGTSMMVKIIDRSVDGIAIDAPRQPHIGTPIQVGRLRGIVLRHTPRGFVVVSTSSECAEPLMPQELPQLRAG